MNRWFVLALAALFALPIVTSARADEADDRAQAAELIRQSQQLADEGDGDAAMGPLLQALEIAPDNPSVHAHLGYLHELQDQPLKAFASYAKLLELRPDDQYGRDRITHIFFGGQFPRKLKFSLLGYSPV